MTWNYRILMAKTDKSSFNQELKDLVEDDYYRIIEVYYNDDGEIEGWGYSEDPLVSETIEDLKDILKLLPEAFKKPVLREVEGKLEEIS